MVRSRLKIVVVIALFVVINVNVAFGYNIYNFTNVEIYAWDNSAGIVIGGYSGTISAQSSGSCPGNSFGCGSNNQICFCLSSSCVSNPASIDPSVLASYCWTGLDVPAHGWVEISGSSSSADCSQMTCSVFDANGNTLYSGKCIDPLTTGNSCYQLPPAPAAN